MTPLDRLLPSSPRRRRRVLWAAGAAGVAACIGIALALVPEHKGRATRSAPAAPAFEATTAPPLFTTTVDPATERARVAAEDAARPLVRTFLVALRDRTRLAAAHDLLAPSLRDDYRLSDWRAGRDLPLSIPKDASYGEPLVAFSDATTVGFVASMPSATDASTLYALRFVRAAGGWKIDYTRRGHSSAYVSAGSFAPDGFYPGSPTHRGRSMLILIAGVLGVFVVVGVLSGWLGRPRRARTS